MDQVHSMAMRQMGDAHAAEGVIQAVYLVPVRKACFLHRSTLLPGAQDLQPVKKKHAIKSGFPRSNAYLASV